MLPITAQATPAVLLVAPGAGFQIRRNTIANNRGSGIVLQAQGGLVANNMLTSPKYWGIQVSTTLNILRAQSLAAVFLWGEAQ